MNYRFRRACSSEAAFIINYDHPRIMHIHIYNILWAFMSVCARFPSIKRRVKNSFTLHLFLVHRRSYIIIIIIIVPNCYYYYCKLNTYCKNIKILLQQRNRKPVTFARNDRRAT